MTPLNLTPLSTQSISALSASLRLCVRQNDDTRFDESSTYSTSA